MSIKLKQAQERFFNWHRLGKRKGRASKQLMQEALSLLSDYSMSQISEALQISINSLKRWKNASDNKNEKINFVSLPVLANEKTLFPNNEDDFHLTLPHGMQLSLKGQSVEKSVHFICALIKEFKTCSI